MPPIGAHSPELIGCPLYPQKADMDQSGCDVRYVPKADMVQHGRDVRYVPKADILRCGKKRAIRSRCRQSRLGRAGLC